MTAPSFIYRKIQNARPLGESFHPPTDKMDSDIEEESKTIEEGEEKHKRYLRRRKIKLLLGYEEKENS